MREAGSFSIRYKTALVFLITGLVPFLAIGTLVFLDFQTALRDSTFRHLEAVTNLEEARVNDLINTYSQGAKNLSDAQHLRQAMQRYLESPGTKNQLHQALVDALNGGPYGRVLRFQELTLTDTAGKVIDSTNPSSLGTTLPVEPGLLLTDISKDKQGVHLRFASAMVYDGKVRTRLYLVVDGAQLFAITASREGLGDTGEIFLVKRLDDLTGVFVTPLRFAPDAALNKRIPLSETNRPSAQAVLKKEETFTAGAVSYRGQPVIAVTRYIKDARLGIVGQVDQVEVFGPIQQLAVQVVVFAALLILFTLFVSSFMAELFVRPILRLATAAGKLRRGDFSARAEVTSGDEIGQLGHTFNSMAEDLARQDQAKSEVLALISHQLRTPVTAVKGFVALVLQDKHHRLSPDEVKMLKLAFDENEKLNQLITRILDVAHADSGRLVLKSQSADLAKLTAHVVKDHEAVLKLRRQIVEFTPPAKPFMAMVDREKLGFVIGNLLTNASKYSPPDSKVVVKLTQDARHYRITVTDSGLGISPADQHKLFQKFSRIENPKHDTAEGMGLGLYMAKKIVDLHGGTLRVDSRENHGSSFTIELPTKA